MVKFLLRSSVLSALSVACAMSLGTAAHAVSFNINAGAGLAANPEALSAFNRAADVWSNIFSDPVEINLDVDLRSFGQDRQNVLGSASPVILQSSYELQRARLIADGADEPNNLAVNFLPEEFDATLPNNNFVLSDNALATKANLDMREGRVLGSQPGNQEQLPLRNHEWLPLHNPHHLLRRRDPRDLDRPWCNALRCQLRLSHPHEGGCCDSLT